MEKLTSSQSELSEDIYLVFELEARGHNFDCERGVIKMFAITNREINHYLYGDDKRGTHLHFIQKILLLVNDCNLIKGIFEVKVLSFFFFPNHR